MGVVQAGANSCGEARHEYHPDRAESALPVNPSAAKNLVESRNRITSKSGFAVTLFEITSIRDR